jgi:hypothetical protein
LKQWKLLKSEEEKAEYRRQRREHYNNMTIEQRAKWDNHRKTYHQKWLANLPLDERQAYKSRIRSNWQTFSDNMSPEKKAEIKQHIKDNAKKKYANLPKPVKQKRVQDRKEHWKQLTPEEIEHRKRAASEKASAKNLRVKTIVVRHYSNDTMRCAKCGLSDIRGLCVDHINGGGRQEMRKLGIKGGTAFYRWLIRNNFPSGNYQVLCAYCNTIKVAENKENTYRYRQAHSV